MPQAINYTRSPEWNPHHLNGPYHGAIDKAEDGHINGQHKHDTELLPGGIEMILDPVVRRAVPVPLERIGVARFLDIKKYASPQHAVDAIDLWTVRVFGRLALGMVFAVNGRPFLGSHAGRQPQPQTEEMSGQRMQIQSAMRLMAVQVYGY